MIYRLDDARLVIRTSLFAFLIAVISFTEIANTIQKPEISVDGTSVTLYWTAPGDDGNNGQASLYDLRYATESVGNDANAWWLTADTVSGEPRPSPAGHIDSCKITGLTSGQIYYFAIKTADEVFNWSGISNIAMKGYSKCADVNGDGKVNIMDIGKLRNFIYNHGPGLVPGTGDLDGNGIIDIRDITYLIKFLYKGGPAPVCS